MNDILKKICETRLQNVKSAKMARPLEGLYAGIKNLPETRSFAKKIKEKIDAQDTALIAEVKRASPSQGDIRQDFDPVRHALDYQRAGAVCLSVLTEPHFFKGDDLYIHAVKKVCDLPVLRKDFMIDPYQIIESRFIGADCILVIMAALSDTQTQEICATAREMQLDILIEVHTQAEAERVFHLDLPYDLIGINNRDLKSLKIDLNTSLALKKNMPAGIPIISESGINTPADIKMMRQHGIYGFLIGTALMRHPDVFTATRHILSKN